MPNIDVSGAPDRLLANKKVTPGHCLEYVSRAIRNGQPPLIWSGLDTALNCWNLACGDKQDSRNVPLGFPAFLGSKRGSNAGDVIISLGNGKFAATDWPGWGVVGVCTLAQREAQTGRKYLGYAGQFLGYTLTGTAGASLDATRITEQEEDDMKLYASRNGDGSGAIGLINPDGTLDWLDLGEYNALLRTGLIDTYHQEPDGTVWNILTARTARIRASAHGDPAALAASVAALVVPAVVSVLAGDNNITETAIEAATEKAVRAVFADAAA